MKETVNKRGFQRAGERRAAMSRVFGSGSGGGVGRGGAGGGNVVSCEVKDGVICSVQPVPTKDSFISSFIVDPERIFGAGITHSGVRERDFRKTQARENIDVLPLSKYTSMVWRDASTGYSLHKG